MPKPNWSAGLHTLSQYLMGYAQKKDEEKRRKEEEDKRKAWRADEWAHQDERDYWSRFDAQAFDAAGQIRARERRKEDLSREDARYADTLAHQSRLEAMDRDQFEEQKRVNQSLINKREAAPTPEYKNADLRQMIIDAAGGFTPPKEHWSDKKGDTSYGPDLISDAEAMASVGVLDPAIASAIGSYGPGVDPNVAAEAAYRAAYPPLDPRREQEIVIQLGGNAYPGGMKQEGEKLKFLGVDWINKDKEAIALSDPKADDVLSALAKASVDGKITDAEMGRIAQKYGWTRNDLDAFLAKKRIMGVTEPPPPPPPPGPPPAGFTSPAEFKRLWLEGG